MTNEESRISYLQIIQGVVNRLASNSFMIKGWSVTLVAALFALAASKSNLVFVYLAYFPALMFWELDAYFLRQERLFRNLYDHAREVEVSGIDFSIDTQPFEGQVDSMWRVACSSTLLLFHGSLTVAIVLAMGLLALA